MGSLSRQTRSFRSRAGPSRSDLAGCHFRMKHLRTTVPLLVVPIVTMLTIWWDRSVNDVTNNPKPGDVLLARAIWCSAIIVLVLIPVLFGRSGKDKETVRSILLTLVIVAVGGLGLVRATAWGWPHLWSDPDFELLSDAYLVSAVGFSLTAVSVIRSRRSREGGAARLGIGIAVLSIAVAILSSFTLIFVE